jgi:hypothetical protein
MNELLCHLHRDQSHTLCPPDKPYHDELVSLHIENYTLGTYYCRKTKHIGGICMFIHNSVTFTTVNIDSYCLDQDTEVCAIHLNSVYDKLCILAIYRYSLGNFKTFLTNFDFILHKFFKLRFIFLYMETLILFTLQRVIKN